MSTVISAIDNLAIEPNPDDFPGIETGKDRPFVEITLGAITLAGLVSLLAASGVVAGIVYGANELYQQAKRVYFIAAGTEFERVSKEDSFLPHYRAKK